MSRADCWQRLEGLAAAQTVTRSTPEVCHLRRKRPLRAAPLALALVWMACASCDSKRDTAAGAARSSQHREDAGAPSDGGVGEDRSTEVLRRPDLAAYHGWIKYLRQRSEQLTGAPKRSAARRLAGWAKRILADPGLLGDLRGVQEWAYESRADGSGQPFFVEIPPDYDPRNPAAVSVQLHGYGEDHTSHASDLARPGQFEIAVLGRSRGGGYRGLGELDVLDALDFVQKHWVTDPDRVHLMGMSMGGEGAFWIAARHPERFASLATACGWATDKPLENLLTLPLYATHGADDPVVPVLHSRLTATQLLSLGGDVTYREVSGWGHEIWRDPSVIAAVEPWRATRVRPRSQNVTRINFTALDGQASRAWWAEVVEWGTEPEPARFVLEATNSHALRAELTNVSTLALHLDESPFQSTRPLQVIVNGQRTRLGAPLPALAFLHSRSGSWSLDATAPQLPPSSHSPGGANQVYQGAPLLVVQGTSGTAEIRAALESTAGAVAEVSHAGLLGPDQNARDPAGHRKNLFGSLEVKRDREVQAQDLRTRNMILVGTREQNSVVDLIADQLPVSYAGNVVTFADGVRASASDPIWVLVYYVPNAPEHRLLWIASPTASGYPTALKAARLIASSGLDSIVLQADDACLVLGRSFDAHWTLLPRERTPLLPQELQSTSDLEQWIAGSIRKASRVDYALAMDEGFKLGAPRWPSRQRAQVQGVTRVSDVAGLMYSVPIHVVTLLGSELAEAESALSSHRDAYFVPKVSGTQPGEAYRVALRSDQLWAFSKLTHISPRDSSRADVTAADALKRAMTSDLPRRAVSAQPPPR